jgi:hypothetical protein
LGTRRHSEAR